MLPTIEEEEPNRPTLSPRRQRIDLYDAERTLRVYSESVDRLLILMQGSLSDHPDEHRDKKN